MLLLYHTTGANGIANHIARGHKPAPGTLGIPPGTHRQVLPRQKRGSVGRPRTVIYMSLHEFVIYMSV